MNGNIPLIDKIQNTPVIKGDYTFKFMKLRSSFK